MKPSRNGKTTLSFTDICKSCLSCELWVSQICLLKLFAKIPEFTECPKSCFQKVITSSNSGPLHIHNHKYNASLENIKKRTKSRKIWRENFFDSFSKFCSFPYAQLFQSTRVQLWVIRSLRTSRCCFVRLNMIGWNSECGSHCTGHVVLGHIFITTPLENTFDRSVLKSKKRYTRVMSGNFGHQVNSDMYLQTAAILVIRIFTVC